MVRNRRGMELAVNTLVVLILGVIIVGGGIALMYNIYEQAQVTIDHISQQQQDQLFQILLGTKQPIAVLDNVQTVARGDKAIFPVAVQNQIDAPSATFLAKNPVNAAVAPAATNTDCTQSTATHRDTCPSISLLEVKITVKRYDMFSFPVVVTVPKKAVAGQYIFNLNVMNVTSVGTLNPYTRTILSVTVE
jgi:hypothetical protein